MIAHQLSNGESAGARSKGYTLLESAAVLAAIGLLAGVLAPALRPERGAVKPASAEPQVQSDSTAGATPTVACCFPGACTNAPSASLCLANGGIPGPTGSVCGQFNCDTPGACCAPVGCFHAPPSQCLPPGIFKGFGTSCTEPGICGPPTEACCVEGGARCVDTDPSSCVEQFDGLPLGQGTLCEGDSDNDNVDDACQQDEPCEDCGPGDHWIDECAAGLDNLATGALVGLDTDFDCQMDTNLILHGPALIRRSGPLDDSVQYPGLAPDDGHLEVLDTEMLSMQLAGGGVILRAGQGHSIGDPIRPTLGAISEQGDPSNADSFFDVFFEIEISAGNFVYNRSPLRVQSKITCVPPGNNYFHPVGCIPLFKTPFPDASEPVANLVTASHDPFVGCGSDATGPCAQPHDTPYCNDELCCSRVCEVSPFCCEVAWNDNCAGLARKICEPFGACCARGPCEAPGTCTPSPGFPSCNFELGCFCAKSAEGTPECSPDFSCSAPTCVNGTIDCPSGLVCLVDTCCGEPKCGPQDCPLDGAAAHAEIDDSAGTATGRSPQTAGGIIPAGSCQMMTRTECEFFGGLFQGDGTNCELVDCVPEEACCLPNGRCIVGDPGRCREAHGVPQGPGSVCSGDEDGDGIDDLCVARPCEECGPGPHWIHLPNLCPPGGSGQDTMPSGAVAGIDFNDDCIADVNLVLGGPVTIGKRGPHDDSAQYPGLRPVDGHLDVIDTEILSMHLSSGAASLIAGGGLGMIPLRPSTGAIAEDLGNPLLANSFFDVFFEFTDGEIVGYNLTPVRVATDITCLPPDGIYAHVTGCTPMYSSPFPGQGTFLGNLVAANHFTYPGCCVGGDCRKETPQACENLGGKVVPDCLGDNDNDNIDDACEQQACCLGNGLCVVTTPERCREDHGFPLGPNSQCLGDNNNDGIDDACGTEPCGECGPGNHWIHNPPCPLGGEGQDTVPSGAVAGIDFGGDCIADVNLVMQGPATIRKRGPSDTAAFFPGLRPVDGHLDVINTELLSMTLSGGGAVLIAGGGLGNIPLRPSHGAVAEQPGNPSLADSFFDVFFEVDLGGTRLYNRSPVRVETVVPCLPPDGIYHHVTGCLPLYLSPIPNDDRPVAYLVSANHFTYPDCCRPDGTCVADVPATQCEAGGGRIVAECLGDGNGNQVDDACEPKCRPTENGSACEPVACPSQDQRCQPRCVRFDPATGRIRVTDCECGTGNACHVGFTPQSGCVVPDNGTGTASLPPAGCPYVSPADVHRIIDGLPAGTTIELAAVHRDFVCNAGAVIGVCSFGADVDCREDGGSLGGEKECAESMLELNLHGTGVLAGFDRLVQVPIGFETHVGPRALGEAIQSFETDMFRLFGQITGDPDFDLLRIVGGTDFGLPSPGHTTLTDLGGSWSVDSFFDITYRIDFVGKPGGPLSGMSGSTTATIRMRAGGGSAAFTCVGGCPTAPVPEFCRPTRTPNPDGTFDVCCDCRAGVVEVDHFDNTVAQMVLQFPQGGGELIKLSGPTTVHVFFEGANEGTADDDDGDGRDEVATEMVGMQLHGVSPIFGEIEVRLHPTKPSRGQIEETANVQSGRLDLPPFAPDGTADSFFDVFFEIQLGARVLHTQQPKRMSSVIRHKPPAPGDTYENPDKIPLLDENGSPTGFSIGPGRHIPRPPVEVDHFESSLGQIVLQYPDGVDEVIPVGGPTTVHVFFEGNAEGTADDDDGDGRDDVDTEMVQLDLTGFSPRLGPFQIRVHPGKPSRGQIEETVNTVDGRLDLPPFAPAGTADSFFDIFFEIHVGDRRFHTQEPKRMRSMINHKPPAPGDTYENPDKIPILDENGNPTGISIGPGRHIPIPLPACCLPDGRCDHVLPERCRDAGGIPLGPNSRCGGDSDPKNGIDDACEADKPCEDCGPGPHWVDQCPGGADNMPTGGVIGVDLDGDCQADVNAVLNGPAHVIRSFPLDDSLQFPGLRPLDLHRDVLDTEIIAMQLTGGGVVLRAGGGMGQGGLRRSLGAIAELPADPNLADSFFDVFFELDLGGGQFAYNLEPLTVRTRIDCVPPQAVYFHQVGCVALYDSPFGGEKVANLVSAKHGTFPRCGDDFAGDCFEPHHGPACNREECCERVCKALPQCCEGSWTEECARTACEVCSPVHLQSTIPPFTPVGQQVPPPNGTLWRNLRHVLRVRFDGNIAAPAAGQIEIRQLLPNGLFGPDLSASFDYSVESGNILRIREPSPTLTVLRDRQWYAILTKCGQWPGVAPFEVHFPVKVGDANGDRFTTPTDVSQINGAPGGAQPDQSRVDINGDGFKTPVDVSIANASQGPAGIKPSGH